MLPRCVPPAVLALTFVLTSCRKPEVETYRVPKETTAQAALPPSHPPVGAGAAAASGSMAGGTMANTPVATATGEGLTWTAPAHWKAGPAMPMRKGTYVITREGMEGEAILTLTAFPGDVGGDLANLNRWRSQINLPPIAEGELESSVQRVERNQLRMTVVDLMGTGVPAQRVLGAIIPYEGSTWFAKLTGPAPIVEKEKAAFTAFLDTIKPAK